MAFDLLSVDGDDLTARPYRERRARLEDLQLAGSAWSTLPSYDDGEALWAATAELGWEGVVAKRCSVGATYRSGRSRGWMKAKHMRSASRRIVGWSPRSRRGWGGVVLARAETGADGAPLLHFSGVAALALPRAERELLLGFLRAAAQPECSLARPRPNPGGLWVPPVLDAEVSYLEEGVHGLRHATVRSIGMTA